MTICQVPLTILILYILLWEQESQYLLPDIPLTRLAPRPLFRDGVGRVIPFDALDFKGVPVDVVLKLHPLLALVSPVLKGERQVA